MMVQEAKTTRHGSTKGEEQLFVYMCGLRVPRHLPADTTPGAAESTRSSIARLRALSCGVRLAVPSKVLSSHLMARPHGNAQQRLDLLAAGSTTCVPAHTNTDVAVDACHHAIAASIM
jgi:hypothetical protein